MREMLALEERPNVFVDERDFSEEEKVDDGKSVDEDATMREVDEVDEVEDEDEVDEVGDEVEEEEEEEEVVFGAKRIDVDVTVTKVDVTVTKVDDENT